MESIYCNAQIRRETEELCRINETGDLLLKQPWKSLGFRQGALRPDTESGKDCCDLENSGDIRIEHLAEAIQYRSLDRLNWSEKN